MNQTRQIGPNHAATLAVPRDWAMKRPISRMRALVISTAGVMAWARLGTVSSPSTAESTLVPVAPTTTPFEPITSPPKRRRAAWALSGAEPAVDDGAFIGGDLALRAGEGNGVVQTASRSATQAPRMAFTVSGASCWT